MGMLPWVWGCPTQTPPLPQPLPGTGALAGSRISPELIAQAGQSEISVGVPGNPGERPQEPPGMDLVFVPGEIPVPAHCAQGILQIPAGIIGVLTASLLWQWRSRAQTCSPPSAKGI